VWAREQLLNKRDILVQCNYRYVMSGVFSNSRYVPPEICRGDYCFDPRAWEASLRWRNITFNIGTDVQCEGSELSLSGDCDFELIAVSVRRSIFLLENFMSAF